MIDMELESAGSGSPSTTANPGPSNSRPPPPLRPQAPLANVLNPAVGGPGPRFSSLFDDPMLGPRPVQPPNWIGTPGLHPMPLRAPQFFNSSNQPLVPPPPPRFVPPPPSANYPQSLFIPPAHWSTAAAGNHQPPLPCRFPPAVPFLSLSNLNELFRPSMGTAFGANMPGGPPPPLQVEEEANTSR